MRSISFRLSLGLFISLILVFSSLWIVSSYSIHQLVEQQITTRLTHDAETLLSQITLSEDGTPTIDSSRVDQIYHRPFSGHYYVIQSSHRSLYSRSLWDQSLAINMQLTHGKVIRITGPQQQPLLAKIHHYTVLDHPVVIVTAEDLTGIEKDFIQFRNRFGLIALVLMLVLIALQALTVRTSLRPVAGITRQLKELEQGKRSQLEEKAPVELESLIHEFNRLLGLMNQRLLRSRNALGNLAHALKKPLTVLRQLGNDVNEEQHLLLENIKAQTDEIQHTIDHVLKKARLAGEGPAVSQFSLDTDLKALANTLQRMYPDKLIHVSTTLPQMTTLPMDREDMMELFGNLLDNACKWAKKNIYLALSMNESLSICIEDDGKGVDDASLQTLSNRGTRLDEQTPGHGLGLSIAQEIVNEYQGSIRFEKSSAHGGLSVTVKLPFSA
jgi:signal transduction histidine kinase